MSARTRIAIVGYGLIGQRHAAVAGQIPGLLLAAVVDDDRDKRAVAARLGCNVHAGLADLLADESPDGIILATPTAQHARQASLCIDAGIPTLIEKPIAATVKEARAVVRAAESVQIPLLIGHHRRYNGIVAAAKTAINSGLIGEMRAVHATCWLAKPPQYFLDQPWRQGPAAGPVSVNLVHDVDLLRVLCGEVACVKAMATPSRRGHANHDLAAAVLQFRSGVIGTITVADCVAAPWSWEMTSGENPAYPSINSSCYLFGGTRGSLSMPDLTLWRHSGPPDWMTPMSAERVPHQAGEPLHRQMTHFVDVLHRRVRPDVSGIEGLRSLEVIEAIRMASETDRTIMIDAGD
ncbi:MAG: Gfo/Idh/MocA family oxidoreductase [Rhodobacteraceae bacterium]|nr:Gfo/Idh/MocA family oxidoreductase [Paracoccaceae bacterium]